MRYENFKTGYDAPTIITGQQYGTKISVELDHSDTDLDELMTAFETLVVGLGYRKDAWKEWIVQRAEEYNEDDAEAQIKQFEDEVRDTIKNRLNEKPHWDWDNTEGPEEDCGCINYDEDDEKRMDVIGQNGNEGTHYYKDSEGFEDYKGQFEDWKNETPDEDEFEDEDGGFQAPPQNKVLTDAKKQNEEQLKKESNILSRKKNKKTTK